MQLKQLVLDVDRAPVVCAQAFSRMKETVSKQVLVHPLIQFTDSQFEFTD